MACSSAREADTSEIMPWKDEAHRRYFYGQDKNGKICALVVLAQLSIRHGYQVKYSLDFNGALSWTIEYITLHAIRAAEASGAKIMTFGSAATSERQAVHNLSGFRVKMLRHVYQQISRYFKVAQKSDFRAKLGGQESPLYVCYPPHGLGMKGSKAIVDFFESEH